MAGFASVYCRANTFVPAPFTPVFELAFMRKNLANNRESAASGALPKSGWDLYRHAAMGDSTRFGLGLRPDAIRDSIRSPNLFQSFDESSDAVAVFHHGARISREMREICRDCGRNGKQ